MANNQSTTHRRALVFGASGVSGWAIVNAALHYPTPSTFSKIIGLTNRPLTITDTQFPNDPRISLHSGVDLSKKETLLQKLREIPKIEKITHVYFTAYTGHGSNFQELKRANVEILRNAVEALEQVCPKMEFFTLQTGGKAYGIEFVKELGGPPVPTPETTPRIPEPYASNIFYYAQADYLKSLFQSPSPPSWKYCEIRPDVIIGFVPQNNAMNAAQALALWLSLYRSVYGAGASIAFPGPPLEGGKNTAWTAKRVDTSQDVLAKFHLFASLNPGKVSGRVFNVADGIPEAVSWESIWPGICSYFGLKGIPPDGSVKGLDWILSQKENWGKLEEENGLRKGSLKGTTWEFLEGVMGGKTGESVDRQYDLSAIRQVGFEEKVDTVKGYCIAFDRMRKAKIIP